MRDYCKGRPIFGVRTRGYSKLPHEGISLLDYQQFLWQKTPSVGIGEVSLDRKTFSRYRITSRYVRTRSRCALLTLVDSFLSSLCMSQDLTKKYCRSYLWDNKPDPSEIITYWVGRVLTCAKGGRMALSNTMEAVPDLGTSIGVICRQLSASCHQPTSPNWEKLYFKNQSIVLRKIEGVGSLLCSLSYISQEGRTPSPSYPPDTVMHPSTTFNKPPIKIFLVLY
jgi:hypothetical protein